MSDSNFTKGEWRIRSRSGYGYGSTIYDLSPVCTNIENKSDAQLFLMSREMYAMLESNMNEMHALIESHDALQSRLTRSDSLDEPDKWDQESLHLNQLLLTKARGEQVDKQ